MTVIRIVPNLNARDPVGLAAFYRQAFGLEQPFEMGWIAFLETRGSQKIEMHTASQGGSDTDLPAISIEVDDLEQTERAVRNAGGTVVYGPVDEPWGLRRFYMRDPENNLINVLSNHSGG